MAQLFRRILVPHDFSEHADAALRAAADLAGQRRGRLTVLHVLGVFNTGEGYPTQIDLAAAPASRLIADLQTALTARVVRVLGRRARSSTCRAVMGDPATAIVKAARQADTIVMATLGRTGLSHLLIGSVAEKVVRHAPVPVLTIRYAAKTRRARARAAAPKRNTRRKQRRR